MLNSLGILFVIEAILVLQPTGTYNMVQKKRVSICLSYFVLKSHMLIHESNRLHIHMPLS